MNTAFDTLGAPPALSRPPRYRIRGGRRPSLSYCLAAIHAGGELVPTERLATKADVPAVGTDLYRALLVRTFAIAGLPFAALRLFG